MNYYKPLLRCNMIRINSFCDTINRLRSFCDETIIISMTRIELVNMLKSSNVDNNLVAKLLPVNVEQVNINTIGLDNFHTLLNETLVSQSTYIIKNCNYRTITQHEINERQFSDNELVLNNNYYIVKKRFIDSIEALQTRTLLFTDSK